MNISRKRWNAGAIGGVLSRYGQVMSLVAERPSSTLCSTRETWVDMRRSPGIIRHTHRVVHRTAWPWARHHGISA
jgi:hypothetical protein